MKEKKIKTGSKSNAYIGVQKPWFSITVNHRLLGLLHESASLGISFIISLLPALYGLSLGNTWAWALVGFKSI